MREKGYDIKSRVAADHPSRVALQGMVRKHKAAQDDGVPHSLWRRSPRPSTLSLVLPPISMCFVSAPSDRGACRSTEWTLARRRQPDLPR